MEEFKELITTLKTDMVEKFNDFKNEANKSIDKLESIAECNKNKITGLCKDIEHINKDLDGIKVTIVSEIKDIKDAIEKEVSLIWKGMESLKTDIKTTITDTINIEVKNRDSKIELAQKDLKIAVWCTVGTAAIFILWQLLSKKVFGI